jgi:hypothetical protein
VDGQGKGENFFNVKNIILSKGSLKTRNLLLLIKIWTCECLSTKQVRERVDVSASVVKP